MHHCYNEEEEEQDWMFKISHKEQKFSVENNDLPKNKYFKKLFSDDDDDDDDGKQHI